MKLLDLPHFERFRGNQKVKVLRHKDSNNDLWAILKEEKFQKYQDGQSWDVFGDAQYIISFIGENGHFAKFIGVWEVLSKKKKNRKGFQYRTEEVEGFQDLVGRLIIGWGEGMRSWSQAMHRQGNKEIVEILPPNYVSKFPGYQNVSISYDQLNKMINNPDSNREWQRMLSSISGIYIILDQQTGKQYIGSAYGKGGIWGRWKQYAKNLHGGNKHLKTLISKSPNRYRRFLFSILRVLEPGSTKNEVIESERITKAKLGSRAFGLNGN